MLQDFLAGNESLSKTDIEEAFMRVYGETTGIFSFGTARIQSWVTGFLIWDDGSQPR